jgi:hypothetical protein
MGGREGGLRLMSVGDGGGEFEMRESRSDIAETSRLVATICGGE